MLFTKMHLHAKIGVKSSMGVDESDHDVSVANCESFVGLCSAGSSRRKLVTILEVNSARDRIRGVCTRKPWTLFSSTTTSRVLI